MNVLAIIPTYNERRNIPVLIERINAAVRDHALDILVVDDNSPDGTAEAVRALQQAHPNVTLRVRPGKLGLASAYISILIEVQRGALAHRRYDAILTMDADLSHPPEYLPAMLDKLSEYDFVNGSRYVPGGAIENWSFHRRLLSYFGNLYVRTLLRTGIRDMSSGFTAFRTEILENINLEQVKATGYAFLSEIKFLFSHLHVRICEVPITFTDRVNGDSKISQSIIREGLLMPWYLLSKGVRHYIECVTCRLCGGVADYAFNKSGFNLFACRDCRLIQVHPPVSSERLRRYYHTTYFKAHKTDTLSYTDYDKAMPFKRPLFAAVTREIKALVGVRDVLDIGSAYGDFVTHLTSAGYNAEGVELSEHAADVARSRGVKVHLSTAEEFARAHAASRYDLLTLLDVLEHFSDPVQTFAELRGLVRDEGYALIITPSSDALLRRLLGRHWYLFTLPQHLNYFNAATIRLLADKQGWQVLSCRPLWKKFSLAYFLHFFSVWSGLHWLDHLHCAVFDRLVFTYPFRDNILVILRKKPGGGTA